VYLFGDILVFRNRAAVLGLLVLTLVCGAHSQTLQGDWQGTLSAPNGEIPCVFHLDAGGGGTLTAQGNNVPLHYTANGSQITITVSQINGSYGATVNGNQMNGTWKQNGQSAPLTLTKASPGNDAGGGGGHGGGGNAGGGGTTDALQGDWQGTLSAPNGGIPCVFHLDAGGSGTLTAQGNTVPLHYSVNGSQITITVSQINGSYTATVNGSQMNGTWKQNGQSAPLTVNKQ
jgi:hypothetical protein